jgi:hypothetical protein
MKFGAKVKFGFSAIQAGQKSATVNAEPRLIANSTLGKFVVTAPVSKAMGVAVGENIMFINNISEVEAAIAQRDVDIVNWANENGIDLETREGQDAALKEFTIWGIAKGIAKYTSKGEPIMVSERYTKEDKQKFINANLAELVAENREMLIERNGGVDADDEVLGALITPDDIESPKVQDYTGSKTATTSSSTGVGCQLNFTDTSIWTALKADLEDKQSKNRVFKVYVDEPLSGDNIVADNGKEKVKIVVYPIEYISDEDPIVRGEKA